MASLTGRIVTRLSSLPTSAASFTRTGIDYDYAIGGLPFLSGAGKERPIERQTADYRKQQVDQGADPGEQSLNFWWLRSQSSFHAGTGIVYEEPDQNFPNNVYRFADSLGVDPWTLGKVSLLPATYLNKSATNPVIVHGCVDSAGPTDIYLQAETTALSRVTDGANAPITWGGAANILALCDDGTNYYAADSVGIWKGTLAGGAGAKIWNTGSANVRIAWVKQRLMAGIGASIYDLSPAGTGGPVLPTAKYTHPNANWIWTAITETPDSIIAAGYAGATSAVYRFALNTSGDVPTLNAGVIGMALPNGEQVYSLLSYLGDYVAVGTNKGVRIASLDTTSGAMQYGPLSILSTQPVRSLTGKDRFVYAACTSQLGGNSGVWRLDMGTQVAFRRFSYATDLQTHVAGTVQRIGQFGSSGRLVIGVDSHGSYLEDPNHLEPSGSVTTGRIRFHTLEPKLFKYVRPRVSSMAGTLNVSVIDPNGIVSSLATYDATNGVLLDETAFSSSIGPQEYVSLQLTLTRDATLTNTGPVLAGYQVKALPAAKRQRNFLLPLMCFDYEQDHHAVVVGGEGAAITRLEALEALEEAGDLVLLQDLTRDPMRKHLVVIDQVRFVQDTPPKNAAGWGGYVFVTLRAVT